jgi:hypothetical protein
MNRNVAEQYFDLIIKIVEELDIKKNPEKLLNVDKTASPKNCPEKNRR